MDSLRARSASAARSSPQPLQGTPVRCRGTRSVKSGSGAKLAVHVDRQNFRGAPPYLRDKKANLPRQSHHDFSLPHFLRSELDDVSCEPGAPISSLSVKRRLSPSSRCSSISRLDRVHKQLWIDGLSLKSAPEMLLDENRCGARRTDRNDVSVSEFPHLSKNRLTKQTRWERPKRYVKLKAVIAVEDCKRIKGSGVRGKP